MRVLLTNNTLAERAGSELYIYDVAVELLRRGHQPIAFSTVLGPVADRLRDATVPVVDDLTRVGTPPDIIHGQHHFETLLAVLSFPTAPAINFCHGWTPWEELPLVFPRVLRYVAVDQTCRDRLEFEHGIPADRIDLILNFVDTARFHARSPLPARPIRALAFGNPFTEDGSAPVLRSACEKSGVELDIVGIGSGRSLSNPEAVLGNYDIVFAKARAALEAMAVGAAVVLCGPRGLGPMVTPENWDRLRVLNFGVRSLTLPMDVENTAAQIARYSADGAAAVSARVRTEATLHDAVDQLLCVYEKVIQEHSHGNYDQAGCEIATARYLRSHASTFKGRASSQTSLAELAQLRHEIAVASGRSQQLEREIQQEREHRNHAEAMRDHTRQELENTIEQLRMETGEVKRLGSEISESKAACDRLEQDIQQEREQRNHAEATRDRMRQELENTIEQLRMETGEVKRLGFAVSESKATCDRLELGLREARAGTLQEESRKAALEQQLAHARNDSERYRRELELLQESATWRLAQRAFKSAPFRAIAPLVELFGRYVRSRPRHEKLPVR